MKESIAAIRWVSRGLLVAAMLISGWTSYKFFTEPGYLAALVLGPPEQIALVPSDRAEMGRLRSGRLPQAGGPVLTARGPVQGQGNPEAGHAAPVAGRVAQDAQSDGTAGATTAYTPPVAQRKVIRVGE